MKPQHLKDSPFRLWVLHMYNDCCKEREQFGEPPIKDVKRYYNKYKWWLRREYKHQKGISNDHSN